jgi:hypothetical protein
MFLPRPLAPLFRQVMTTILSLTIYKYKNLLIIIRDLIILFVLSYAGSGDTPDSILEDQTRGYDDFSLDYFNFLHDVPTQEELGGSQLPSAQPIGTQTSPGGLPGSSHQVAGSAAAAATPPAAADARRRQIHPRDMLRTLASRCGPYPEQTACNIRGGVARLGCILFRQQHSYL